MSFRNVMRTIAMVAIAGLAGNLLTELITSHNWAAAVATSLRQALLLVALTLTLWLDYRREQKDQWREGAKYDWLAAAASCLDEAGSEITCHSVYAVANLAWAAQSSSFVVKMRDGRYFERYIVAAIAEAGTNPHSGYNQRLLRSEKLGREVFFMGASSARETTEYQTTLRFFRNTLKRIDFDFPDSDLFYGELACALQGRENVAKTVMRFADIDTRQPSSVLAARAADYVAVFLENVMAREDAFRADFLEYVKDTLQELKAMFREAVPVSPVAAAGPSFGLQG